MKSAAMRLAFMGTPEFASVALSALLGAGHEIACVYTQPPRPAHRGKKLVPSPVHQLAEQHGLAVRTPVSLRDPVAQAAFADLDLDAAVVAAYGLILPQPILDAPRFGCLNIHASLLPRWRGAAPIHRAIMAGDTESGICIMQMDAGLDTGPVLLRASTPILPEETTGSLHDKLAAMGGKLIVDALAGIPALGAQPQPSDGITYAHKIDKSEARLDFHKSAQELERLIRAFNPAPGAYLEIEGERLRILRAEAEAAPAGSSLPPGTLLNAGFQIACGANTCLRPTLIQRAGRQPVPLADFLRGFALPVGRQLA